MSDESTLAKMLDTPKGKIVINSFVDELSQTNDVFKAYDKAVIVAKKEGILGVLQIGAGMDLLTILKYLAPIIIDQWRKNERISQQGKR